MSVNSKNVLFLASILVIGAMLAAVFDVSTGVSIGERFKYAEAASDFFHVLWGASIALALKRFKYLSK